MRLLDGSTTLSRPRRLARAAWPALPTRCSSRCSLPPRLPSAVVLRRRRAVRRRAAAVALFLLLRQFVLRRGYFGAWTTAWMAFASGDPRACDPIRFVPGLAGSALPDGHPAVRTLYFVYQLAKGLGFVFFLRGTVLYVAGARRVVRDEALLRRRDGVRARVDRRLARRA